MSVPLFFRLLSPTLRNGSGGNQENYCIWGDAKRIPSVEL
jgi:hypothetical protein